MEPVGEPYWKMIKLLVSLFSEEMNASLVGMG